MPPPTPQSAIESSTPAIAPAAAVVVNPYLKRESTAVDHEDAAAPCSRRKFMARYPSLPGAVKSVSAAEKWKRRRIDTDADGDRMFLFRGQLDGSTRSTVSASKRQNGNRESGTVDKKHYQAAVAAAIQLENDITELSGEGGSGKTQVCLSAIVDCVMRKQNRDVNANDNSRNAIDNTFADSTNTTTHSQVNSTNIHTKAIYISTKCSTTNSTARRLAIMTHSRLSSQLYSSPSSGVLPQTILQSTLEAQTNLILENIYLISCTNEESLMEFVTDTLPILLQQSHVGLIVLDDIASLYRCADPSLYDNLQTNAMHVRDRSGDLWTLSRTFRKLADMYEVPVLVVNQVTAISSSCFRPYGGTIGGNVPALGMVWSHCVGMRIMLRRGSHFLEEVKKDSSDATVSKRPVCLRYARVIQALNMPAIELRFAVEERGVRLLQR